MKNADVLNDMEVHENLLLDMNQILQINFFSLKISVFETESAEGIIFLVVKFFCSKYLLLKLKFIF